MIRIKKIYVNLITCVWILGASCLFINANAQSNTKRIADLGFTTPTKVVVFVENENKKIKPATAKKHNEMSKKIRLHYGPMRTDLFVANTKAKSLKFTTRHDVYFIDINTLPKRNAMIVFDGENKPVIYYNPKKYHEVTDYIIDRKF